LFEFIAVACEKTFRFGRGFDLETFRIELNIWMCQALATTTLVLAVGYIKLSQCSSTLLLSC